MTKKCLILCRTSGNDTERDSLSLQEQVCREFAESNKWDIVKVLKEDVTGVSGADPYPPQLMKALKLAQQGEYEILLLRDQIRFSRDVEKAYFFKFKFRMAGVDVWYVQGDNSKTESSEMMNLVQFGFGSWERAQIAKRMHARKRHNANSGSMITSPNNTPFGYITVKQDKIFVPQIEEKEAEIIRLIFDLYVNKEMSINGIARHLTDMKIPTFSQLRGPTRFGDSSSIWHSGVIRRILANETYCGVWYYGKTKVTTTHNQEGKKVYNYIKLDESNHIAVNVPAIIDRAMWEQAKEKLESNKQKAGRPAKYPDKYLLRKRVTCMCGKKMVVTHNTLGYRNFFGYKCNSSKLPGTTCSFNTIKAETVDNLAWHWLTVALKDKDLDSRLDKWITSLEETNEQLKIEYKVISERLEALNKKYDNLLNLIIEASDFGKQKQKTKLQEIEKDIEHYESDVLERLQMEIENNQGEIGLYLTLKHHREEIENSPFYHSTLTALDRPMTMAEKQAEIEKYDVRARILNDDEIEFSCNLDISDIVSLSAHSKATMIRLTDIFPLSMVLPEISILA